jgi:hypothetical protein
MKNEQLVDLHEVDAYWKSRGLVDEKHLPYYIRWLQRFLVGAGRVLECGDKCIRSPLFN